MFRDSLWLWYVFTNKWVIVIFHCVSNYSISSGFKHTFVQKSREKKHIKREFSKLVFRVWSRNFAEKNEFCVFFVYNKKELDLISSKTLLKLTSVWKKKQTDWSCMEHQHQNVVFFKICLFLNTFPLFFFFTKYFLLKSTIFKMLSFYINFTLKITCGWYFWCFVLLLALIPPSVLLE